MIVTISLFLESQAMAEKKTAQAVGLKFLLRHIFNKLHCATRLFAVDAENHTFRKDTVDVVQSDVIV